MKRKTKFPLSTTHIILLSFLFTILLGSLLLSLPISTSDGNSVSYIDALFTSTTATCVTGLVTLPTFSTWSIFGQAVILILIQIGGLGIITVMSGFMIMLNRKMGIADRLLIQDAFNLNTLSGLAKFIKKILIGTLAVECIGAILYMTVFIPEFGAKGIWISFFNAVSAFCNAGIDIIGEKSLCDYATNPIINTVTSLLIITGGIGYVVWWDILRVFKKRNAKAKNIFRFLTLQTKIAISATLLLVFGGGILIFIFEYSNPATIGDLSLFDKIQVSLFQSVTTRTAGFASIPQENLSGATTVISLVLMFIGGSPVGTAGGVKTVTAVILLASAISTIRNKNSVEIFHRALSPSSIKKAVAVVSAFIIIMITSTVLLAATVNAPIIDIIYESMSATATVGLSRNLTPCLNIIGKAIVIATMYLGRVGPISLAFAFGSKSESQNIINEPTEEIIVG